MYGSRPSKQFMVFIITFLLLSITMITCFTPRSQSEGGLPSLIDQNDGFYYSDTFSEISSSNLNQTVISSGNILLDPQGTTDYIYDFSDWTNASSNRAYYYNTIYFLNFYPPSSHIARENELGNADYTRIATQDSNTYPSLTSGQATSRQQVQHYRFKITQDINSLTKLGLYWHGKAENDLKITLYYWQPFNFGSFGLWQKADETTSNGSFVSLRQNFTGDLFVDSNGYIDICVVLTPAYSTKCTLYTDYVDISCQGSGYASKGTVQSIPIQPDHIDRWEQLYWKDFEESQTSIQYHLLYENETGILHYVDNNYVPGNLNGLSQSPVDLSSIPASYNLTIQANLSTADLSLSPTLYHWGVSWQTTEHRWQDSFNSTLRIDKERLENIEITAGNANLIPVANHWPMFAGPTAANTRSSEGVGPDDDHTDLAWYSEVNTGGENKNPVIKNANMYVSSQNGEKIYCFDAQANTGTITFNPVETQSEIPSHLIKNTPLVTDDYVVVATGSSTKGGGIGNKIYGFDHNLGDSPEWSFDYASVNTNNPSICYHASPVHSDGNMYITSWSGDDSILSSIWNYINFSKGINILMKLDADGNYEWEYALPTGSFCSPAVKDGTIVACCDRINGDSVFAVNHDGVEQWKQNIGPVGYASPVIYEDKVIVVTKKPSMLPVTAYTAVYALNLSDGTIVWNQSIGDNTVEPYQYAGYNTPTVAEDKVFVCSPDGVLYAFNIDDGSELWKKNVYAKGIFSTDYLLSSPAYADGIIYIGNPDGTMFAIDAENNETLWTKNTIDGTGIISSSVVVDGLLYYIEK
ncbi:MAG: PQQ-binding-like beta-propeller repeat protein, partial [Thermoplasmatota archaeon]